MGRLDPSASAMRHPVAPHSRFVALPLLRVAHPTVGRLSGSCRVAPTVLANAGRGRLHLALWTAPVRDRVCRDRGASPQAGDPRSTAELAECTYASAIPGGRTSGLPQAHGGSLSCACLPLPGCRGRSRARPPLSAREAAARGCRLARQRGRHRPPEDAMRRRYDRLRLLSVGRIEEEKNPLLLADVLARLHEIDPRWRHRAGEGPLEGQLKDASTPSGSPDSASCAATSPWDRISLLSTGRATRSSIPLGRRTSAGALRGICAGLADDRDRRRWSTRRLNGRVRLIPPNDADAAARELTAVARDPNLRARLIRAGHEYVRSRTLSREAERVPELFIRLLGQ